MTTEQMAVWIFGLTAAYIYQFIKGILGLQEKVALWGLFVYAFIVAILATLIGGSGIPPLTDPLALLGWLTTHVSPIIALATLLYKGFGKKDGDEYVPGLGISRLG
jgi:hypothetical protein